MHVTYKITTTFLVQGLIVGRPYNIKYNVLLSTLW